MIAQDTGSAIVGPARGDFFFGSGEEPGRRAGLLRHAVRFVVLQPKPRS
jgi:membrane-bound lytic murein transglycosylase A